MDAVLSGREKDGARSDQLRYHASVYQRQVNGGGATLPEQQGVVFLNDRCSLLSRRGFYGFKSSSADRWCN